MKKTLIFVLMFSMIIMLVSCKSSSNESSVYGKMPVAVSGRIEIEQSGS